MTWLLWAWSNIAFTGSLAALAALWWFSPSRLTMPLLSAILIVSSAVIGAFGWGEKRAVDGREAGALAERVKWEKSFNELKAQKDKELAQAKSAIEVIRSKFVAEQSAKDAAKQAAAISNARVFAILNSQPSNPKTITCEKANEQITIPACPNPYALRVDSRIVRNLQRSRNQNPSGGNTK